MSDWTTVSRREKVRPARGGGGQGGSGAGGNGANQWSEGSVRGGGRGGVGTGAGGGAGGGARPRTRLRPSDTRPNIYIRPNTVVMECGEFSVLPPDEEVVDFIYEQVLTEADNKALFQQVESLFADKNARKYLIRIAGSWMSHRIPLRVMIITGFSMEKPRTITSLFFSSFQ